MTNQEEPVKKSGKWDMIAIQEECKKKYPIGCTYEDDFSYVLELDEYTYGIFCNNMIYAHSGGGCLFNHGTWAKLISLPETTIEDNPVKELIELPYKWCIKVTKENQPIVGKYYNRKGAIAYTDADRIGKYLSSHNLSSGISVMSETENHGSNFCMTTCESYTEITFDQFKKWVLKEVYDCQFPTKITSIDKWSVGTYVVFIKTVSPLRALGFIDKITDSYSNSVNLEKSANCVMQRETDGEIKWFATKQEAEDFVKTLIIENTYESTSKRVLLEQAKKRYPVGTVIDSLGGMLNEIISTNDPYFVGNGTDSIRFNNDQLVYSNGEWAKIISKPTSISSSFNMQEILEEAKRRFPIGCTFYPIQKNGSLSTSVYTQKQECRIYRSDDGPDWIIGTANVRNGDGKWAKIVSLPKEKEHPFQYIPVQNYPQPTPMESYNFKLVDLNSVYKNDKFVLPIIPIITPLLRV
jgi:hypothetical protein